MLTWKHTRTLLRYITDMIRRCLDMDEAQNTAIHLKF